MAARAQSAPKDPTLTIRRASRMIPVSAMQNIARLSYHPKSAKHFGSKFTRSVTIFIRRSVNDGWIRQHVIYVAHLLDSF
jgi:hypothetical protein